MASRYDASMPEALLFTSSNDEYFSVDTKFLSFEETSLPSNVESPSSNDKLLTYASILVSIEQSSKHDMAIAGCKGLN